MVGKKWHSVSSCAGHVTTETIFGQTLALWLGNGDDQHALELDTTGLNVMGNLYLWDLSVLQGETNTADCLSRVTSTLKRLQF